MLRAIAVVLVGCGSPSSHTAPAQPLVNTRSPPATSMVVNVHVTKIWPSGADYRGGTFIQLDGSGFYAEPLEHSTLRAYVGSRECEVINRSGDKVVVKAPPGRIGDRTDIVLLFEPGGAVRVPGAVTFVFKW